MARVKKKKTLLFSIRGPILQSAIFRRVVWSNQTKNVTTANTINTL